MSYGGSPGVGIGVTCTARIAATQADEHHGSALPAKGAVTLCASAGTVKRLTAASVIRHSDFIESLRYTGQHIGP